MISYERTHWYSYKATLLEANVFGVGNTEDEAIEDLKSKVKKFISQLKKEDYSNRYYPKPYEQTS